MSKAGKGVAQLYRRFVNKKAMVRVLDYAATSDRPASMGVEIPVNVLDVRFAWGNPHVLVSPVLGGGQAWVSVDRVKLVDEWPHEKDAASTDGLDGIGELGVGESTEQVPKTD